MQDIKDALIRIHNELMTISVKGDDTIALANCLHGLRQIIKYYVNEEEREEKEYE